MPRVTGKCPVLEALAEVGSAVVRCAIYLDLVTISGGLQYKIHSVYSHGTSHICRSKSVLKTDITEFK